MTSDERTRVYEHLTDTQAEQSATPGETAWYVDMRTRQIVRRTVGRRPARSGWQGSSDSAQS